ncbi:MAG TPA: ArsR family transcriptional regulator [Candidatus Nanoarchaeia archaeon]|nr:ArsR family transcriptional regulator [Candidatus Nanoarchaeia archaeon]
MKKQLWEDYGYVVRGNLRKKILLHIDKPITPRELSKQLNLHLSEASRVLIELSNKGLVECLTPKLKSGRVYELTKQGKDIKNKLTK